MIDRLKDEEFRGKLFFGLMTLLILVGIAFQYYKQRDIKLNEAKTTGRIVKYWYHGTVRVSIKYEYYVNGKLFTGQVGVSPFSCDNGKRGCLGEEFNVYYSVDSPDYSRISLGKYEQYKTTVEFFD